MPKDDSKKDGTVTVNIEEFTKTRDSVSFLFFSSFPWALRGTRASVNNDRFAPRPQSRHSMPSLSLCFSCSLPTLLASLAISVETRMV
jgi:hypothetical protein